MSNALSFALAIDNVSLRERIEAKLHALNVMSIHSGEAVSAFRLSREERANSVIFLETNDDAARLVQVVNDLHHSPYHEGGGLPVICIVSEKTFEQNMSLGFWLIQGHAAVISVQTSETVVENLRNMVAALSRSSASQEPAPKLPTYDALVSDLLANPNNGHALMALAKRLAVWQDDHFMSRAMRVALMRHAVALIPESVEARLMYGKSLSVHAEKERGLAELREAVRLAAAAAETHQELGSALSFIAPQEALREWETAIALDPGGLTGKQAENGIRMTRLRERIKEASENSNR